MASVLAKIMKKVMKGMPVIEDVQKEREANASRRPPQAPAHAGACGSVLRWRTEPGADSCSLPFSAREPPLPQGAGSPQSGS